MHITWHGSGAVKIVEKEVTVAINPHDGKETKMPKFSANLLLLGMPDADVSAIREKPFVIDKPGEYEVQGVFVYGISAQNKDGSIIIFTLDIAGVTLGYLGGIEQDELTNTQLEHIEGVDILFVPVGGKNTLDAKRAIKMINQIEPRIVIPIQYKDKGMKTGQAPVDDFVKAYGVKPEEENKLKVTKKDLPQEDTKVVIIHST